MLVWGIGHAVGQAEHGRLWIQGSSTPGSLAESGFPDKIGVLLKSKGWILDKPRQQALTGLSTQPWSGSCPALCSTWLFPGPVSAHAVQGAVHGLRLSPCHPGLCFAPSQTQMLCGFSPHNAKRQFQVLRLLPRLFRQTYASGFFASLNVQLCYLHIKLQVTNPACQWFRRPASL